MHLRFLSPYVCVNKGLIRTRLWMTHWKQLTRVIYAGACISQNGVVQPRREDEGESLKGSRASTHPCVVPDLSYENVTCIPRALSTFSIYLTSHFSLLTPHLLHKERAAYTRARRAFTTRVSPSPRCHVFWLWILLLPLEKVRAFERSSSYVSHISLRKKITNADTSAAFGYLLIWEMFACVMVLQRVISSHELLRDIV